MTLDKTLSVTPDTIPMLWECGQMDITSGNELSRRLDAQAQEIQQLKDKIVTLEHELGRVQTILSSLPIPTAAQQAIKVSEQNILDAAAKIEDATLCARRVIIWGRFTKELPPTQLGKFLLGNLSSPSVPNPSRCSWLIAKKSRGTQGLLVEFNSPDTVQDVIAQKGNIKSIHKLVRGVSVDRPLHMRNRTKLDEKRPPPVDTKLKNMPVVQLTRLELPKVMGSASIKPDSYPASSFLPLASSSPNCSLSYDVDDLPTVIDLNQRLELKPKNATKKKAGPPRRPPVIRSQGIGLLGSPPANRPRLGQKPPVARCNNRPYPPQILPPVLSPHFRSQATQTRPPDTPALGTKNKAANKQAPQKVPPQRRAAKGNPKNAIPISRVPSLKPPTLGPSPQLTFLINLLNLLTGST